MMDCRDEKEPEKRGRRSLDSINRRLLEIEKDIISIRRIKVTLSEINAKLDTFL